MKRPNTTMRNSVSLIILLLTIIACATSPVQTVPATPTDTSNEPRWVESNVAQLPIADDKAALIELANLLCSWYAPHGQKVYAMKLASRAAQIDKKDRKAALALARTAFFAADGTDDESAIKQYAETGAAAARLAGTDNPEACYYFALNQGIVIRSKGLAALTKLPEIHEALQKAQAAEALDMGGPLRVLGMLYLKAPAWPSGIGDLDKALELLSKAVRTYPAHPLNHLFYAEALIEDDNPEEAKSHLDVAERLAIPEIWGIYYAQRWNNEIQKLKQKIAK